MVIGTIMVEPFLATALDGNEMRLFGISWFPSGSTTLKLKDDVGVDVNGLDLEIYFARASGLHHNDVFGYERKHDNFITALIKESSGGGNSRVNLGHAVMVTFSMLRFSAEL